MYDIITLEESDSIELTCDDPSLPSNIGNLAYRAAALLQSRFFFPGVRIELHKSIPSGAGLGGGSSDAAFVLRGLIKLFGLKPDASELTEIAAKIGSDVPFFLGTGQASIEGRGEIVKTVDLPVNYDIIIVKPPQSISTRDVYRQANLGLTRKSPIHLLSKKISLSRLLAMSGEFRNDLEEIVLSRFSDLVYLKRTLLGTGAFLSGMTGSGSCFFGLFVQGTRPCGHFENLEERGYSVFCCRPILLPPTLI